MRVRVSTAIGEAKQLRLTGGQFTHIDFRCGDRASATFLRDSSAITASTLPWLGLQKLPSYEASFVGRQSRGTLRASIKESIYVIVAPR